MGRRTEPAKNLASSATAGARRTRSSTPGAASIRSYQIAKKTIARANRMFGYCRDTGMSEMESGLPVCLSSKRSAIVRCSSEFQS